MKSHDEVFQLCYLLSSESPPHPLLPVPVVVTFKVHPRIHALAPLVWRGLYGPDLTKGVLLHGQGSVFLIKTLCAVGGTLLKRQTEWTEWV